MKRKSCVWRYMARQMWTEECLPALVFVGLLGTPIAIMVGLFAWMYRHWPFAADLLLFTLFGWAIMGFIQLIKNSILEDYQKARRECGYDD